MHYKIINMELVEKSREKGNVIRILIKGADCSEKPRSAMVKSAPGINEFLELTKSAFTKTKVTVELPVLGRIKGRTVQFKEDRTGENGSFTIYHLSSDEILETITKAISKT